MIGFAVPRAHASAPRTDPPGIKTFSYNFGGGRILRCSMDEALDGTPAQARCDGWDHGKMAFAKSLVGGNRQRLAAQIKACNALEQKYPEAAADVAGLQVDGRSAGIIGCVGDAEDPSPFLAVGKSASEGPFTCTAMSTGLQCTDTFKHGFFFGKTTWRTF